MCDILQYLSHLVVAFTYLNQMAAVASKMCHLKDKCVTNSVLTTEVQAIMFLMYMGGAWFECCSRHRLLSPR
jgi:hypothetical protein